MRSSLESSLTARPAFGYIGGKRNLAARIIERVEAIPHRTYAEPFLGAGGVFLRRPAGARSEVVNDISREVATFFRILQRHYTPFMDMLRYQLTSRAEFERLLKVDPDTLTDLERAARFLYVQRNSYGSRVRSPSFGVSPGLPGRFNVTRLGPILEDLHARLAGVVIECLPYGEFIARYDRAETLFYLDPPYWGSETDYGRGLFSREDFGRLAEQLAGIKGRFILSLNDRPEVRATFGGFRIEEVATTYAIGGRRSPGGTPELLITGPKPL